MAAATPAVLCIGNAAFDRIHRIAAFPPTPMKVPALDYLEVGGGMAANAAVAAARLGARVSLWSRVGDDRVGGAIIDELTQEGIATGGIAVHAGFRSPASSIIVDQVGERLIVGNRAHVMPSDTTMLSLEDVERADVLMGDLRWLEAVTLGFRHARSIGRPTVLDADLGNHDQLPLLLPLTDYAIFSQPALQQYTGTTNDVEGLAKVCAEGVAHAGVTRGSAGYLWSDCEGRSGEQPAFAVDVIDTTGAGDAFHGAFAFAIAQGMNVEAAAALASAVSAMKCRALGGRAGLPTLKKARAFLAQAAPLPTL